MIKVKWYNPEKTIILQKRDPGWKWADFDAAVDQYTSLARSVDHRVAIIVDCLDAPNPPSSSALGHYRRAADLKPENLVLMVIVSPGGFLKMMGEVFTRAAPGDREFLQFVPTMKDAEALCAEVLSPTASAGSAA
jgi:hypothetical protein